MHSIRSALSDYNVPKSSKTESYIMCTDQKTLETVTKFKLEIATFANCSKVELADTSSMPTGCAILSVSDKCQVHLLLKVIILKLSAEHVFHQEVIQILFLIRA